MARASSVVAQAYDVLTTDEKAGLLKTASSQQGSGVFQTKTKKPHLTKIKKNGLLWRPSLVAEQEYRDGKKQSYFGARAPTSPHGFRGRSFQAVFLPDNYCFPRFYTRFGAEKN